jgi:hypothetical protein
VEKELKKPKKKEMTRTRLKGHKIEEKKGKAHGNKENKNKLNKMEGLDGIDEDDESDELDNRLEKKEKSKRIEIGNEIEENLNQQKNKQLPLVTPTFQVYSYLHFSCFIFLCRKRVRMLPLLRKFLDLRII